jgi:NAD(P) transhydrogenase
MLPDNNYDLIVIGSGPAGEKGAAQAAYFGKRVAIIEKEKALGGAAANTGTLPSKTLRETSLTLSGFRKRELYGMDISLQRKASVKDFLRRERDVVDYERERIAGNISRHKVDLFFGEASFTDPHTINIKKHDGENITLHGEVILVATGSRPRQPDIYPFDDPRVFDSDTILHLQNMPKSMVIIGGGVIGCEYACTFAALDIEVHLVESRDILLSFLDKEMSVALRDQMSKLGIYFQMPCRVSQCNRNEEYLEVILDSGHSIKSDSILVCSGRISNTASLNLESAGLSTGANGLIEVDKNYCTPVSHIYAAGDVIGFPALASTSMEQARIAMVHAFQLKYKESLAPILPYGIFTIPEVSMAGETEESLQKQNIDYIVGRARYSANARGQIIGDQDGFVKLIYRQPDMKLLGVHVIGESATELVHIGLTGLLTDAHAELFIRTCYNYPTLGELYKYATYDAMGKMAYFQKSE